LRGLPIAYWPEKKGFPRHQRPAERLRLYTGHPESQ